MDMAEFQKQCLGEFKVSDHDKHLHSLAKEYHESTEAFDKLVCSSLNDKGIAMPTSHWEQGKINRNALVVKRALLKVNPSVSPRELNKAISNYNFTQK